MKSKIVFFGSSKFVIPIIEVLRRNFNLKLVVTTEHPALASQGETLRSYPVVEYCINNKIPYISVSNLSTLNFQLSTFNSPVAVLADFGLIIPPAILNFFPKGIINIHPSLLPKYRGPTPAQTAILNGEKTTGVSIIKLDEEIDHGPILFRKEEKILNNDTSESLYERLFRKGADLLPDVLRKYLNGSLIPTEQNHKYATFTKTLTRQDGFIEMSNVKCQMSNAELDRMIRAYFPWPGVWTKTMINDKELRIKFLPENKIQAEGKKPVSYKNFLSGYPEAKVLMKRILDVKD